MKIRDQHHNINTLLLFYKVVYPWSYSKTLYLMALVFFFFFLNNDKFRIRKLFFKHTLWRFYTACFIVIFFFISLLLFCSLYRSALDISRGHGEDQNCLRWFVELKTGVEYHIEETTIKDWPKSVGSSTRFPIFVSVELRLNEIPISKGV